MKTLEQLIEERHSPIPTFTYNKDIPVIVVEWLTQKYKEITKRELKENQWYGSPILNELLEELK
jgi:hypothetical protein